jgi:DDE superfamily endonuclease
MNIEKIKRNERLFKSVFGVTTQQFNAMLIILKRHEQKYEKGGRPRTFNLELSFLILLFYYKTYSTYDTCALVFSGYNHDKSVIKRTIDYMEKVFLKSKIVLAKPRDTAILILDATEQRCFKSEGCYSGKKKTHTIKHQIVVNLKGEVVSFTENYKGSVHDFDIYKENRVESKSLLLADSGYQGIQKIEESVFIPIKKKRGKERTVYEKKHNQTLSKIRVKVEHVFCHVKKFQIMRDLYRNKNHKKNVINTIVYGIYNFKKGVEM